MKYLIISILVLGIVGCTSNNIKAKNSKSTDLKEFYFPLENDLIPTTYTYEVKTETQGGVKVSYEYLKFEKIDGHNYSFSTYGGNMNLIDSSIFEVDDYGINLTEYLIVTEDSSIVTADVNPELIFPWDWSLQEKIQNEISYQSKMYGSLTKSSVLMSSNFVSFVNFDNSISKESKSAKISVQTDMQFKNIETREEIKYTSKGVVIDLKGIGMYKSEETNNFGVKITKKLIEIIKAPNTH